jgi:hypothetical protein
MECKICKTEHEELHLHHIIPKSRGGLDVEDNLIQLCIDCHGKAHDVSFRTKKGIISKGHQKRNQKEEEDQKWLNKNHDKIDEFFDTIYDKNIAIYYLVTELIKQDCFKYPSQKRALFEEGRVIINKCELTI